MCNSVRPLELVSAKQPKFALPFRALMSKSSGDVAGPTARLPFVRLVTRTGLWIQAVGEASGAAARNLTSDLPGGSSACYNVAVSKAHDNVKSSLQTCLFQAQGSRRLACAGHD